MPTSSIPQFGTAAQNGFSSGHLLAAAIAWTIVAVLCYCVPIPLSNARSQQNLLANRKSSVPIWLRNRYADAALVFAFHAVISANRRINVWVLPLTTIVVSLLPQSDGSRDSDVSILGQMVAGWKISPKGTNGDVLRPSIWLTACVTSITVALMHGCTKTEFGIGVMYAVVGTLLYTASESMLNPEHHSSREIRRNLLVPIALQSAVSAAISWMLLRGEIPTGSSLALMSLISAFKGFALVLSVLEGTALPILATLSASTVLERTAQSSLWSVLTTAVLLASTITQILLSLPKSTEKKHKLIIYIIAPLLILSTLQFVTLGPASLPTTALDVHPIQSLHERNKAEFERKVLAQSQDHVAAEAEYTARYGRSPPPNFDKWFAIAKANSFQLPDEFDTIMTSIMPYWGLPSKLLRDRLRSATEIVGIYPVQMRNSNATFGGDHYHGDLITSWINKYSQINLFPDFDFAVNVLDEPRISAPYAEVSSALNHEGAAAGEGQGDVVWETPSRYEMKSTLSPACPDKISTPKQEFPLPFISDITTAKDFCLNPSLFDNHGFFLAPETVIIARQLVPVLSQCKPDRFNDILYPSPYYTLLEEKETLREEDDMDWKYKRNNLYWSGSSTGGHSTPTNWRHLHRQHLALLSTTESNTTLQLLVHQQPSSTWHIYNTTWSAVRSLLNIRLNRLVQCGDDDDDPTLSACEAMKPSFPLAGTSDPVEMSLASKYALDMDGNTFTGRFYRLLKSKSCVLKMTAFKEWHDSFLTPWVHYIPVSSGFEELGEIMRYVNRDEMGMEIGKKVADEGRTWARKALRGVDLELVALRVLMEVARLVADDSGDR